MKKYPAMFLIFAGPFIVLPAAARARLTTSYVYNNNALLNRTLVYARTRRAGNRKKSSEKETLAENPHVSRFEFLGSTSRPQTRSENPATEGNRGRLKSGSVYVEPIAADFAKRLLLSVDDEVQSMISISVRKKAVESERWRKSEH